MNKAMDDGRTPLFVAAYEGHEAMVSELACSGSDVSEVRVTFVNELDADDCDSHHCRDVVAGMRVLDLAFDVFNFVDSLPSVSVALAAEGLDSKLAAKEDVCIACLDAGPRGDLVLVHGGHGGDQSAMHGMCRL